MSRSTKTERKLRHEEALQALSDGYGVTEAATYLSQKWGTSRKTALRSINAAHLELVQDLDEVDRSDLLIKLVNTLERTIRRAEKAKQFSAVVGAVKVMNEMVIKVPQRPQKRTWLY